MSHIVTIKTEMKDPSAITAACARLQLDPPVHGTHDVFGTLRTGLAVGLPGWNFPLVIVTRTGETHQDTYGGRWGKPQEFDRLRQRYAVEKARIEARKKGYGATETTTADGTIELQISIH